MNDQDLLDQAVSAVYEAALNPDLYVELARLLRTGLSAGYVGLFIAHRSENLTFTVPFQDGLGQTDIDRYQYTFAHIDPTVEAALKLPAGTCLPLAGVLPRSQLRASEYYAEYMGDLGLFDGVGAVMENDTNLWAGMSVYFGTRDDVDLPRETQFIARLVPHLRRAVKIHHHLLAMHTEQRESRLSLDALSTAVLLTDHASCVLRTNHAADLLLRREDGIRTQRGVLSALAPGATPRLRDFVYRVSRQDASTPECLVLPRLGKAPLVVRAVPVSRRQEVLVDVSARVILFIHDPEGRKESPDQLLVAAFRLTPAEARLVCALAEGLTLEEHAERARVTKHTSRTQLKHAMAKMGTRRQADLVRLALGLTGSLRP